MTLDQRDAFNAVERSVRRLGAVAEMLAETGHTSADQMRAAFEEIGIGLERAADDLQSITHPEREA